MRRIIKKGTIALLLLSGIFASGLASAACASNQCNNTLTRLYMVNEGDGDLLIGTAGDESQLTNCTPVAGVYLTLEKSSVAFKEIYALLLTAQATGQSLRLRTVDNSDNCSIQYAFLAS